MARENVKLFTEKKITKIITQCPHCLSTIKNDYRQYGLEVEVIHYTELIEKLLAAGKIKLNAGATGFGTTMYHDSCYLGRHNSIYDAPRNVIKAATGTSPVEMERNRNNGFCCGGGGGRMWMEEHTGERININRVSEALLQNPDTICVACPYCLTMFEDGLKDKQASSTKIKDIAEIIVEALQEK